MDSQSGEKTINDLCQTHALCQAQQQLRKQQVLAAFPDQIMEQTFSQWHLALYRFATVRPLVYTNQSTLRKALEFFSKHADLTVQALNCLQSSTTNAFFSLLREGKCWNYERELTLRTPDDILDFESLWHPEYQRYCEHVFNHLIDIPLFVQEELNKKDYRKQALANRVTLLQSWGLEDLTKGFNSIVRNAVSHGKVTFNLFNITYTDIDKTETLMASSFSRLLDDLVDTCHSIAVALLLFLCQYQPLATASGLANLPLGLRFLFIDALASHNGFQLVSIIESQATQNRRQLNIICKINTRAKDCQLVEAINICWNVCRFGGEIYDRFGVSFQCGTQSDPFIFINGKILREAIDRNAAVNGTLSSIIEDNLLFFTGSKLDQKRYLWQNLLTPQWKNLQTQVHKDLCSKGFKLTASQYTIRNIENRSAGSFRRILAHVVVHEEDLLLTEYHEIAKSVVRRLRIHLVRISDLQGEKGLLAPPNYIAIRLYTRDKRLRTLASSDWRSDNLLMMTEWYSKWKNNGAIFVKQPDFVDHTIRIQYNPQLHIKVRQNLLELLEKRTRVLMA